MIKQTTQQPRRSSYKQLNCSEYFNNMGQCFITLSKEARQILYSHDYIKHVQGETIGGKTSKCDHGDTLPCLYIINIYCNECAHLSNRELPKPWLLHLLILSPGDAGEGA